LAWIYFVLFALLLLFVATAQMWVLGYAYEKMGISAKYVYAILVLSLLGSYVNIPIARFTGGEQITAREVTLYGMTYIVPRVEKWPGTILAVNLGGAVIPTAVSIYLIAKNRLYFDSLLGVIVVSIIVYMLAEPVQGMGIAVPVFIPPIVAAVVAVLLSRTSAPPLAYISGTLGTLVGADLLNLHRLAELGAPVVSIGGAGTFDGVFLTGVLAVLLAR
jgi:uncharacterized membrane protein